MYLEHDRLGRMTSFMRVHGRASVGRNRSSGISLIEVMVGVAIIAIGAFAAVTLQRVSTVHTQQSHSRQVAASLARQILESVDSLPYNTNCGTYNGCLSPTGGANTFVTPCAALSPGNPLDESGLNAADGLYTRDWSIVDNGGGAAGNKTNENRKTIRVRVRWTDRDPQQLIVSSIKRWTLPCTP